MNGLIPSGDARARLALLVVDAVRSPHTKRAYTKALEEFFGWAQGRGAFTKALVSSYRAWLEERGLAAATVNVRLAAVRKLAGEAADNGLLAVEAAGAILRVPGARRVGSRVGNWLDRRQAEALLRLPDRSTLKGKRDRAILAVLVGCGLRRGEAAGLTVSGVGLREGRWVLVDLEGKHGRVRSVPAPGWAKAALDEWTEAAGITAGAVFRAVTKGGAVSAAAMTPQAVYYLVEEYAGRLGMKIGPHDLRRTFGRLAHEGGAPLEQIQLSYGHASVATTERYLGVRQNFRDAPCDRLGLEGPGSAEGN